jgi:hypothetical protein
MKNEKPSADTEDQDLPRPRFVESSISLTYVNRCPFKIGQEVKTGVTDDNNDTFEFPGLIGYVEKISTHDPFRFCPRKYTVDVKLLPKLSV